jgi:hypothetical protein
MKKLYVLIGFLFLTLVLPAQAQWHGHGVRHHGHYRGGPGWGYVVAPLIIGGIAGAAIANSRQPDPVILPPPVVDQPPVVIPLGMKMVCTTYQYYTSRQGPYEQRVCQIVPE